LVLINFAGAAIDVNLFTCRKRRSLAVGMHGCPAANSRGSWKQNRAGKPRLSASLRITLNSACPLSGGAHLPDLHSRRSGSGVPQKLVAVRQHPSFAAQLSGISWIESFVWGARRSIKSHETLRKPERFSL